ncbi:tyrosine-type recombinase/integrase [Halomonas sp. AOP35-4E-18]|uniref:tyrosine-type recombinase/integrase n=1 Tax=Halomonas sp. AOP35-4E-18 TaxID=3457686 RepID=UPI004034CD52
MFVSERGAPVSVEEFRKMLGRLSERVLGVTWHPHALRHACGVHLINSGADTRTMQQYLCHASHPKHAGLHGTHRATNVLSAFYQM